jgi:arylsulfatase A-like enzyme
VAVLAVAGWACRPPPARQTVLEPVHRLLALREGEPAELTPPACALEDDTRPALGCPLVVRIGLESRLAREPEPLSRRYPVPSVLAGGTLFVERLYRFSDRDAWKPLAPVVVRGVGADLEVVFALPADAPARPVDVAVRVAPAPPAVRTTATRPVPIGAGAVLTVGVGVEGLGLGSGAAPVEFRLVARTPEGEHQLLHTTLDPADPGARRWNDHRVDLGPLAGRTARFVFTTRVVPRPGQAPADALAVPLWGAPVILEPRPADGRRNVLLVSLDTLRADHVGAYGSDLPTTPALDRVAASGTLFEHAIVTYPSTPGSHMSMMTGAYPSVHGVIGPLDVLPAGMPTLPQIVAGHGYRTAAFTENGMLVAHSGFQRGFDSYHENKGSTVWDASGQVDVTFPAGLRWLQAHRGERFFLFLHTYQVHEPYSPPPAFDLFTTYQEDGQKRPITESTPLAIRDRHAYAGEVRYTDSELARLLDGIAALGELERTLVVITSDHGEEFWEHGWKAHDETLYDEVLRVPLVLRAPGLVPAGLRIPTQVSLVDLAPTVLELLGIPVPPAMQGRSLVPLLRDPGAAPFAERVVFAELTKRKKGTRLWAARTGRRKWIWRDGPGVPVEIYDLRADPEERRNLATPELAAEVAALREQYAALVAAGTARAPGAPTAPATTPPVLDPRTEEKLRALGYVQ